MMVLYSGTTCPYSHRCRFVLFEKGMDFEIRDVDLFAKPEASPTWGWSKSPTRGWSS